MAITKYSYYSETVLDLLWERDPLPCCSGDVLFGRAHVAACGSKCVLLNPPDSIISKFSLSATFFCISIHRPQLCSKEIHAKESASTTSLLSFFRPPKVGDVALRDSIFA